MHGFFNTVLRINLTLQSYEIQIISDAVLRRSLGGKGLATSLLLGYNPPGVDPLSPDNHLIFANGPTAGTAIRGSSRYGVFTKSPRTGYYAESYAGGKVADHISSTGFDAVVFHGAAATPIWVEVHEESVFFHQAGDLWGKSVSETEDFINGWIKDRRPGGGKCGVVAIGPPEESLLPCEVIDSDCWCSAGRTGAGAVLGAKKVKAVAFRGNRVKTVADPDKITAFVRAMNEKPCGDKGDRACSSCGRPTVGVCRAGAAFVNPEPSGSAELASIVGRAATFCQWEDRSTLFDTFVLCRFYRDLYQWEELMGILEGVVGIRFTADELRQIAQNVTEDTRRFNLREEQRPEDDNPQNAYSYVDQKLFE